MAKILFLAHRIPYPPNKGDKIRSWHELRHLAARHEVHLGAFVDDPDDWQYEPVLRDICAEVHLVGINPRIARLKSLRALFSGAPLSLGYYRSREMRDWVRGKLAAGIDRVFLFSSPMAQFIPQGRDRPARLVMDFVDIDSDKWRQYARMHKLPISWVYEREARTLGAYERAVARRADASLFVSEREAELFRAMAPDSAGRVHGLNNGVDHGFFTPDLIFDNPMQGGPNLVFTGAMDYWANAEAVVWFAREVLPLIRARQPGARFVIVGGKPTPAVRALAEIEGVTVTGRVPDVRPYIAHADLVVAPLRVARGVQNKVLEGMAMARPVVTTPQGAEGIACLPDRELWVASGEAGFAQACLHALESEERPAVMTRARARILGSYDWPGNLDRLESVLGIDGTSGTEAMMPAAQAS
jgi:sugar transferase (PEP-CTERM/EpsH1 system associated)